MDHPEGRGVGSGYVAGDQRLAQERRSPVRASSSLPYYRRLPMIVTNSKLYPRYASFETLAEALARAEEMKGYAELWQIIDWMDQNGIFSAN